MLGVGVGDPVTVLVPTTDASGAPEPRLREFTVAGVFDVALQDYDGSLLIAALDDVRALLPNADARMGMHVNFRDALGAPGYAAALAGNLPAGVAISDWTRDHASYFRAIRIEKTMVALILMLIVAVAAFYLVAMLAMVVTDKRTDIAILRTLGTSPRRVMAIFLIQGMVIAWFGVALGVLFGTLDRPQRRRDRAVPRATVPLRVLQLRGLHHHPASLGAALRADRLDRGHRHADHAARDHLPGVARLARAAGRRAAVRVIDSMRGPYEWPYEWTIATRYLRSHASQRLRVVRRVRCRCSAWRSA